MMLDHADWVLVADSEKVLVLENHGDSGHLDLRVRAHDERANPSTRQQGTDRPGRTMSPNAQRSAIDQADWHQLEKKTAAEELARKINAWASARVFRSIVLIADPKTLGMLRSKLQPHARERVAAELDKDLTHHTVEDIERILRDA